MKIETFENPVDSLKIKAVIESGEVIELTASFLSREMEGYINRLISVFLSNCNQQMAISTLTYSCVELLANANKANVKRVYFLEKGLDINNMSDYQKGMVTFSSDTTDTAEEKNHYQELQKENQLYIKFRLFIKNDVITMEVLNNASLTEIENQRIRAEMDSAKKYNNMEEALSEIDRTEGSGLGIIIIILMLRQLGVKKECLQIGCQNNETYARINLPLSEISINQVEAELESI